MSKSKTKKLWGGRFEGATHALMESFNASIGFDRRLAAQDIRASVAHARMLGEQGVITNAEAKAIIKGLKQVRSEIEAGDMAWRNELEDIHTHVEARLTEIIGDTAGKLHTGRSRNDQVATDMRLWVMDACAEIDDALMQYQRALVELADANQDVVMPGYTHMQRAQPVLFAHHMLAYVEMAGRDRERLAGCLKRTATLPLGAAALAGTTFKLNPRMVAKELGFKAVCQNSLDAVSDRDFAAEFLFVLGLTQIHLSRLCEELILWSTQEFGFVGLSDAFSTGSSIMPQKKNPDAAELVRGKTGRVLGDLNAMLIMLKGQPLAYNKDLQEDKEPIFDSFDSVLQGLLVLAPMLQSLTVNPQVMRAAVERGFLDATELADYLAARGVPFRKAHELAGRAVRLAEADGRTLSQIAIEEYQQLSDVIQRDVYKYLKPEAAVSRRRAPGGTAGSNVKAAIKKARKRLWPEG